MPRDILFFDKDCTLGNFYKGGCGLFPGTVEFLEQQSDLGRELHIASSAPAAGIVHLESVKHLLTGYIGREQFRASAGFYVLPNGVLKRIEDDFAHRSELLPEDERKKVYAELSGFADKASDFRLPKEEREAARKRQDEISDYMTQYLNRCTLEPFIEGTRYLNPYFGRGVSTKDLFLARRLLDPMNYNELRTVMVGDETDMDVAAPTDIETPLIRVWQSKFPQGWKPISATIDALFSKEEKPFEVYDSLFKSGKRKRNGTRHVPIGGYTMEFSRGSLGSRLVLWQP